MSQIKDIIAKIKDLKIRISEMAIIYALNNFDLHFWSYLAILSHNGREKEKFLILSELTKALENEQLHLSNENKRITNYAYSSKPKKTKPSEQKKRRGTKKKFDNEKNKKKSEVKEYKICGGKHLGNYWHLNSKYYICHNVGHIVAKYPKKSSNH